MLDHKNIFITGSSGGIGRAILKNCASKGANIWAHIRKENEDFFNYIKVIKTTHNVRIEPLVFDLTDFDAVKSNIIKIHKNKDNVDILINNAGIFTESLFQMTSINIARHLFEVNFFAPFYITQLISKIMIRQQSGGSIINISSVAALDGVEGQSIYGATKSALISMTRSLAKELGRYNIRANCIAPGITETQLIAGMKQEILEREKSSSYLRRLGHPQDIAEVVTFLASDAAKHLTGQVIRVDGGKN